MKSKIALVAAVGIASFALLAQVSFADDGFDTPAMADSTSPDDELATSSDPDSLLEGSDDPDALVTGTEDPDSMVAETEDPDDMVEATEDPDQMLGHSTDLGDLPDADEQLQAMESEALEQARENYQADAIAESAPSEVPASTGGRMDSQIGAIHQAKQKVEEARELAERAENAYGEMMQSNYPRGEARQVIVDERKMANEAFEAAQQSYDALLHELD